MADESPLTEWGQQLKSPDPREREKAARNITQAYTAQLLQVIKYRFNRRLAGRVDPEDVLQSVLASFFNRDASFANRNLMFAYLREIAIHKAQNVGRAHRRQRRDVRRETADDVGAMAEQKRIRPFPLGDQARRAYQCSIEVAPDSQLEADSFFSHGTLEQMRYTKQPDVAALVIDQCRCLQDFDAREGDRLSDIVRHGLRGLRPEEIARELGVSKRTIDRKLELIAKLWDESKTVRVKVEGNADEPDGRPAIVLPKTTTAVLLGRLGLPGDRLAREVVGKRGRIFDSNEVVYGHIADGDILWAC
jgi:RNA polymerase sigma factor (sigma-70 family)